MKDLAFAAADIARVRLGLKCSEEEAIEVLRADKAIDRGERMDFDLDKATEKAALKESHKGKQTAYVFTPRERKPNEEKREIISLLLAALEEQGIAAAASNVERVVDFTIGDRCYSLTLTQHRK